MNIIKTNIDVNNKKTVYKLTKGSGMSVKDVEKGVSFPVELWALYDEEYTKRDGSTEERTVLSMVTGGTKISTISNTFIKSFMEIVDLFENEPFSIIITGGTSTGGREYVSCELDCDD